jgi:hypothetical protein
MKSTTLLLNRISCENFFSSLAPCFVRIYLIMLVECDADFSAVAE